MDLVQATVVNYRTVYVMLGLPQRIAPYVVVLRTTTYPSGRCVDVKCETGATYSEGIEGISQAVVLLLVCWDLPDVEGAVTYLLLYEHGAKIHVSSSS